MGRPRGDVFRAAVSFAGWSCAEPRARKLRATVVEEPHVNPAPQHREMWLRDPDGYFVVLASRFGEAG